jgi:glucose-6-phosphate isomerase
MKSKNKANIIFKNNFLKDNTKTKNKIFFFEEIDVLINQDKSPIKFFNHKYNLDINKKKLNQFNFFKNIVLIGMGGSILGSKSIYSFLKHKIKKNFLFIDNLDKEKTKLINQKYKKSLFIIISKSGNTLETLTNINALNKINFTKKNTIIITENKSNALNKFAKKKKIYTVFHKDYIGGRFSVLSEVGMVPAYFMGLNISKFKKNINSYFKKDIIKTSSLLSKFYKNKKISSIIFMNYSPIMSNLILWCQQLIAESLGKKTMGLMPVLSLAPKDHHSLLQLYLDGPRDKFFYIFSADEVGDKKIEKNNFGSKFNYIKKKSLSQIAFQQKNALVQVFKKKKINFKEIHFKKLNESSLAEFYRYFILETLIVSKLINVNPFNQPAVEEIKQITKKRLIDSKKNI